MTNKDELRQSLLELHYELLDEVETARWRAAIATDPEVAVEWARTLKLAGKMADAARIQTPTKPPVVNVAEWVALSPSENGRVKADGDPPEPIVAELVGIETDSTGQAETGQAETHQTGGRSRWWLWSGIVAATAASLGFALIGSRYLDRVSQTPMAVLSLQAQETAGHQSESDHEYRFVTRRLDSTVSGGALPVTPASLSFSVLAQGTVLFSGDSQTGSDGEGRISLPDDLVIPEGAQLRVTAISADGELQQSVLDVPLEPTRCMTYVTVDRPVYRPGDSVYFRSLTLQRRSLRANVEVPIRFELLDPSGAVVPGAFTEGVTDRGVGNGSFQIPTAAPGGPYTLVAKSLDGFFPEERREFQVRAYRVPRFKKDLEFRRRSYGPGETVEAEFAAERAEGGAVAGVSLRITATVDDQVVHQQNARTSPSGTCVISFDLPDTLSEGIGNLSVVIDDGGTQETQTKSIPIQLGRVAVDFYPEGGYLVDGLKNRVYFAARDTIGEPVHIAGEVLTRSGQSVAKIETVRDGMGRFEFVPVRGERYQLKVTEPVDVTNYPKLPAVVKDLPVIDTGEGVFEPGQPIDLTIGAKSKRSVRLRAVCRGQLVGQQDLQLRPGENSVSLKVRGDAGGVVRITVLDGQTARPLVERLVYRRNAKRLDVEVVADDSALERSPGEPLRLKLQVRDERGNPTPAVLGVSVVDDAALSLDETERPTLQTHFLLTSEIQKPEDLEHANFYLSDDPKANESLDMLLGTQGWRRFVSGSQSQPNVDFREQLIRLIELDGDSVASVPGQFDNSRSAQRAWDRYRALAGVAWDKLILQTQLLIVAVLLIWLGAIIVRLRHRGRLEGPSGAASWLLIATTSFAIYGCGVSETTMLESDRSVSPNARQSEEADGMEMEVGADEEMSNIAPASNAMADEPATEAPPEVDSPPAENASSKDESPPTDGLADPTEGSNPVGIDRSGEWGDGDSDPKYRPFANASGKNRPIAISKEDLQRLLAVRGLDAESLADQLLDELRFPVRQYAHQHRKGNSQVREDFAETLYWQPMLVTDSGGAATVRFDLSDSVTSFRINVDGHSIDGRIGSGGGVVTSRLPLQIEPKLPLEVTTGDRIDLPIAVINATDTDLGVEVSLTTDAAIRPVGDTKRMLSLPGKGRQRAYVALDVVEGSAETDAMIEIRGVAGGTLSDTVRRPIHVSPAGYPARESMAGMLNERGQVRLPIPRDIVKGSLAVTVRAYPSPLADVMSGIEGILREPHGCFEQTSATNYPNTMALLYMQENEIANPDVSRRARGMLDRGYQKLTSFECEKRGYEWFGSDPGHEALSAFGLMQFNDMARIMNVSEEMVTRTRVWLMGRRDGEGGFRRNPRHLHVWSVQQPIVNAYVLWAITEADVASGNGHRSAAELGPELDQMTRVASESDDPYLVGLSAAALMNAQRTADGEALLKKLASLQNDDGGLQGKTTVTSSGGISLKMETTAVATLAFVKSPKYLPQGKAAAKWITTNRQGNSGFGSTQATVLALKALVAISDQLHGQSSGGDLRVLLRGEEIGRAKLPNDPRNGSTVEITGLGTHLQDAEANVEIELVAKGTKQLSYTIDVAYHAITPNSHQACPLELTTELTGRLDGGAVAGDTFTVKTRTVNASTTGLPMTVTIVGLPGGLEPRVEELDELQESGQFDYYELRGREVVFYWRTLGPKAIKEVDFTVTAAIPGQYTAPASRTYLYYTAEQKFWVEPLQVEIVPDDSARP